MKVGELDNIVVDDRQPPDPGTGERGNNPASNASRSDDGDRCSLELALSDSADLRQNDLTSVSLELSVREGHWPVEPKPPAPRLVSLSVSTSRKLALSTGAGTS